MGAVGKAGNDAGGADQGGLELDVGLFLRRWDLLKRGAAKRRMQRLWRILVIT